jgi:hypothetical protein
MATQTIDWQGVLGIADPAPGDTAVVSSLADAYGQVADNAGTARDLLNSSQLAAGSGQTMQAFHDRMGQLPSQIATLADSYGSARDALRAYASALQSAQDQAQRAWAQAEPAHADLVTAQNDVQTSQDQLGAAGGDPAAQASAAGSLQAARNRLSDARQRLDAARSLASQAADLRTGAAHTAASTIDQAASHTIPDRGTWQKISDWFSDNPWIGYLLDALSFILPFLGPLGVLLAAVATLASLAIQLVQMAVSGHWDIVAIVMTVIALVPGSAFSKLGKLLGSGLKELSQLARAGDELGQASHLAEDAARAGDLVGAVGAPSLDDAVNALRGTASSIRSGGSRALQRITGRLRMAGMRTGVRLGPPARWAGEINPGFATDAARRTNCGYTAIAVDDTLRTGRLHIAGTGVSLINGDVETRFESTFEHLLNGSLTSREQIKGIVNNWDEGTRGIVNAMRPKGATGHMFNVVKWNGEPMVIDGQIGVAASFDDPAVDRLFRPVADNNGFSQFRIMRTHGD